MPIDDPEATADVNTRRGFLSRAALGGALFAAAGPLRSVLPAGAQDNEGAPPQSEPAAPVAAGDTPVLPDGPYLLLAAQIEDAAVQVYEAALSDRDALPEDALAAVEQFQKNHMSVVQKLVSLMRAPADQVDRKPDENVLARRDGIGGGPAALATLAQLEQDLAATHLWAIAGIEDSITAKTAAQILTVENEQAVILTRLAEGQLSGLFVPQVTTDGALTESHSAAVAAIEAVEAGETEGSGGEAEDDASATDASEPAAGSDAETPTDDSGADDGASNTEETGN